MTPSNPARRSSSSPAFSSSGFKASLIDQRLRNDKRFRNIIHTFTRQGALLLIFGKKLETLNSSWKVVQWQRLSRSRWTYVVTEVVFSATFPTPKGPFACWSCSLYNISDLFIGKWPVSAPNCCISYNKTGREARYRPQLLHFLQQSPAYWPVEAFCILRWEFMSLIDHSPRC